MKHKPLMLQENPSLFLAVAKGDYALLTRILGSGENINQHRTIDGFTPIFIAVSHNNPSMLKFLLNSGADPAEKSKVGKTAMDLALSSVGFDKEIVKSLLEASGSDSIQEKLTYYEMAKTGIYNADMVSILRKYLDISNQPLIKAKEQPDSDEDEWSWSDNDNDDDIEEQIVSVEQKLRVTSTENHKQEPENYESISFQEDPSAQKYYEHILVAGDSG